MIFRHYDRFGQGGFRYLLDEGVVYTNAHHEHANTETIVGHATLATGAHPSVHGMIGNLWFDRESGHTTYNVEDDRYRLLSENADVNAETEIDPTQRAAKTEGRSPAAIMVTTFADELRAYTAGRSKAIGVSVKDRGAISMAGHAGLAYWFSKATGGFVTSTYYMDSYPGWVRKFNESKPAGSYSNHSWQLLYEPSTYMFNDDQAWEVDVGGFGRTFPHQYGPSENKYFTTFLTLSPAGDEMVLAFAREAIIEEALGQDDVTDFLSVSFSSTDYVGHVFGPSSVEAEDNILRLDRSIASLLQKIDQEIGLDNTIVVLSADHGGPDAPGYMESMKIPAGYIDPDNWDSEAAIERVKTRFSIKGELFQAYQHPYLYLDPAVKQDPSIDQAALEAAIVEEVSKLPGVSMAVASTALRQGNLPDTYLYRTVLNNFNAKRSGDVFIVFEPHWFINDFDGLEVAATHGSPWRYDTHVPIIFAGGGLKPMHIARPVRTIDIAPTLSNLTGALRPSGSTGEPLVEVTRK